MWVASFLVLDVIFLTAFMIELGLKLWAFGWREYLANCLNLVDAIIITLSFLLLLVAIAGVFHLGTQWEEVAAMAPLAPASSTRTQ